MSKAVKLVTFERDQLVEELNDQAIDIAINIHNQVAHTADANNLMDYGWDDYDKNLMNESIDLLKKKHLAYNKGKANMLIRFLMITDVYINKNANNFLKHLNSL